MRIALLTESADPPAVSTGPAPGSAEWCERLARSLPEYAFQRYAADRPAAGSRRGRGRAPRGRHRERCLQYYGALVRALADPRESDTFPTALYALAEATREGGALSALLASDEAQRVLEKSWRGPAAGAGAAPSVRDLLVAGEALERCLRPLAAPWAGEAPAADVCHVVGGGPAVLPALLARRLYGVPFVVTDHRVELRERCLDPADRPQSRPVRALLLAFLRLLVQEGCRQAALLLPGSEHDRRWLEQCGAPPERTRVIREGIADGGAPAVGPEPERPTLLWIHTPGDPTDPGTVRAALDLVRAEIPEVDLRLYDTTAQGRAATGAGPWPVYRQAWVVLLPAPAPARPGPLVEAMLSGRPVVVGELGVAGETVGPAGLLVPPGDPRAAAEACVALLRDPERRARLGTAGRQRAQELHSADGAVEALRSVYLEVVSRWPAFPTAGGRAAEPFARPAEFWAAEADLSERTVA